VEGAIQTANAVVERSDGVSVASRVGSAWDAVGRHGRTLTLVIVAAALACSLVWVPETGYAVATAVSVAVLAVAAMVDVVEHRLPNAVVGLAAVPVVVAMATAWVTGDPAVTGAAATGAALVGGPLLVTHLVSPAGMGFGDVKAGAVLGGALGLINTQVAVLALVLGLSGAAVWALARRRRTIALGPGLVAGALLALVVARVLDVEAVG